VLIFTLLVLFQLILQYFIDWLKPHKKLFFGREKMMSKILNLHLALSLFFFAAQRELRWKKKIIKERITMDK